MSTSISVVGRLGRDSELKTVGSGAVLEFSVASDTGFGDKKVTSWYRCALWGKRGESLQAHLVKGTQVAVFGELTLREYTGKDGVKGMSADVRVHELDLLGKASGSGASAPRPSEPSASHGADDDMPF